MRYAQIIRGCTYVGDRDELGLDCALMFDLNVQVEGRKAVERDRDDFFAFRLDGAVAIGLARDLESG